MIVLRRTFAQSLTVFARNTEEDPAEPVEFVIPEDLAGLTDTELSTLHTQAVENFDGLYGDGTSLTEGDLTALGALTEGIESLSAEVSRREAAAADRADAAAALATRAHPTVEPVAGVEGEEQPETDEGGDTPVEASSGNSTGPHVAVVAEAPAIEGVIVDELPNQIAAGASPRREIRVNLPAMRARAGSPRLPAHQAEGIKDVILASGEGGAFADGTGLDWLGVGQQVDKRLGNFNEGVYSAANAAGRHIRQQFSVATIRKPYAPDQMITSTDRDHVEGVLARATDETRLPGGSLTASGGWCAPSTTLYDLVEIESRDGMFSLPEIGITRGGIMHTLGPDFAAIYALAKGFHYTEVQDENGTYAVDANGVGTGGAGNKPCFRIPCPTFTEDRLEVDGLCITAGLLMQHGYPEVISRTIRGALIAHDHRMAGRLVAKVEAGSTAVTMPAAQRGAISPLLTAIELQVEHYRSVTRISRAATLEAVFPFWVHGAIRTDLSRRTAGDLDTISVSNAQIDQWFRDRGISPQFVYNWQDLVGTPASQTSWPTTVKFLLYAAGTWVRGGSPIITLDTIYDSILLGQNDYTALFTEEGMLVAKRLPDSRVVTVPVCPDGATGQMVAYACDGTTLP